MAKKTKDALTQYNLLREEIDAEGMNDEREANLTEAKAALVEQCKNVLSPKLIVDNASLPALQSGELSLMDAINEERVQFDFEHEDKDSMTAAELFSLVTVDLVDADPEFATLIIQTIARQKIDAVLSAAPAATPQTSKKKMTRRPVQDEEDALAESRAVQNRALSLRNNTTELTTFLVSDGVSSAAAADTIYELSVIDPVQAQAVLAQMPHERRDEMIVGHASIGKTGMLALVSVEEIERQILAQMENDNLKPRAQEKFSDRNNMTAASLVMFMIEERPDHLKVLARLRYNDPQMMEIIINSKAKGGDYEAAAVHRTQLRQFLSEHDADIVSLMEEIAYDETHLEETDTASNEEVTTKVVVPVAPTVNLNAEVDLENL